MYSRKLLLVFNISVIIIFIQDATAQETIDENSSLTTNDKKSNTLTDNLISTGADSPKLEEGVKDVDDVFLSKKELPDTLNSYLTVISILIATAGFIVGLTPQFADKERKRPYVRFIRILLFTTSFFIGYSIILILILQNSYHHLIAFGALALTVITIFWVTQKKK